MKLKLLLDQGLIKGGDLDNAVVIVDHKLNQNQLDDLGKKIGVKEKFVLR